jgi:hypothetical protein
MPAPKDLLSSLLQLRTIIRARGAKVPAFRVGERREKPIIDREEIELGVFRQEPGIRSVAATDGELVQEPRRADVGGGEPPSPVPPSGLSLRSLEPHGNPLLNNEVLKAIIEGLKKS